MNALRRMADRLRLTVATVILITLNMVLAMANLALYVWGTHRWDSFAAALWGVTCSVIIYFLGRKAWGLSTRGQVLGRPASRD